MSSSELVKKLLAQPRFGALVKEVENAITPAIADYLLFRASNPPGSAKAVKDAVWGMIDLTEKETVLIDSPIVQRLRFVKQLGVTYLTYPTAGHSRFEHTLGAMHQAERMLRAIAHRSEQSDELLRYADRVRLAALLHDIGHMPFSHVSERYFSEKECLDAELLLELRSLRAEISELLQVPEPSVGECLSLAIALSPSFQQLLGPKPGAGYDQETSAQAVLLIVGRPPSLGLAFLSQIITNVIDADKLDYMFRDAFATAVPLAVDLERLLYKLRCLNVPIAKCPPLLKSMGGAGESVRVLGTDLAGERHANDLALSRALLFKRVYHHHKTLAAERLVLKMLARLSLRPAALILEDDRLFSRYATDRHPKENSPLLKMLNERNLPRRVYALSYGFLPTESEKDEAPSPSQDVLRGWRKLEGMLADFIHRTELEQKILENRRVVGSLLGMQSTHVEVWTDDNSPETSELPEINLVIESPDKTISQAKKFRGEAAAFVSNPEAVSFFYAMTGDTDLRELLFLAAEVTVAQECEGLSFGRLAADYAKISWSSIETRKREMEAKDPSVYEAVRALRPRSHSARVQCYVERLEVLAKKFSHYNVETQIKLDLSRLQLFLDQFPEHLVPAMVRVLEAVNFVDRSEIGKEFARALRDGATEATTCVPLVSDLWKSPTHIASYLGDHEPIRHQLKSFEDALASAGDITFYDDCSVSGGQARSVIQTWFGLTPDIKENLSRRLTSDQEQALRARAVRFRFLYATEEALGELRKITEQLRLGADIKPVNTLRSETERFEQIVGPADVSKLREFLARVGYALLSDKATRHPEKWTDARRKECSLGYGNFQQLLVFLFNTPTTTVTALWKGGRYGGAEWLPLFPRRDEASPQA